MKKHGRMRCSSSPKTQMTLSHFYEYELNPLEISTPKGNYHPGLGVAELQLVTELSSDVILTTYSDYRTIISSKPMLKTRHIIRY